MSIVRVVTPSEKIDVNVRRLSEIANWKPVMDRIAVLLHGFISDNFEDEGRPQKWKQLNPAYASAKAKAGKSPKILTLSGMLMRSVQSASTQNSATVATNRVYAKIHHYGGEIKPKYGRSLAFKIGGKTVLRGKVVMPARPFMMLTDDDKLELDNEINDFILKRLGLETKVIK